MKTVRELLDSKELDAQDWEHALGISYEDWQKLHHWLGSIWNEEMSVVEIYAKAVEIVPDMTGVGKFFNRPGEIIEFSVGIFADATEYLRKGPIDQLLKMKELQDELMKSGGEYPEDYMAFKEWVWERFVGFEAVFCTMYPRAKNILEKFREDASKTTGYKP